MISSFMSIENAIEVLVAPPTRAISRMPGDTTYLLDVDFDRGPPEPCG